MKPGEHSARGENKRVGPDEVEKQEAGEAMGVESVSVGAESGGEVGGEQSRAPGDEGLDVGVGEPKAFEEMPHRVGAAGVAQMGETRCGARGALRREAERVDKVVGDDELGFVRFGGVAIDWEFQTQCDPEEVHFFSRTATFMDVIKNYEEKFLCVNPISVLSNLLSG